MVIGRLQKMAQTTLLLFDGTMECLMETIMQIRQARI